MARLSNVGPSQPDPATIDLTRLVARLQETLLQPDAQVGKRLRVSSYERRKVETNIEYARSLLLRLEQEAADIKFQSKKQEAQIDLLQKRDVIESLSHRLKELDERADIDSSDETSEGEDILGEDTPSETDEHDTPEASNSPISRSIPNIPILVSPPDREPEPVISELEQLIPSTVRARRGQGSTATDTAQTTSSDTATTAMAEKMMTHNRTEQESLTDSLLNMAQALKASSQAFASSLEDEKEVLDRAGEGIEKNKSGLDAAQNRMGYLRSMSEGKGWWGRMMLYAWIFGLMFAAFFIVAFMPKLRF